MKDNKAVKVKTTPWFKLHKEEGKNIQGINLRKQFGFIPDVIVVERMKNRNNVICVHAILSEEQIKKEKAMKVK